MIEILYNDCYYTSLSSSVFGNIIFIAWISSWWKFYITEKLANAKNQDIFLLCAPVLNIYQHTNFNYFYMHGYVLLAMYMLCIHMLVYMYVIVCVYEYMCVHDRLYISRRPHFFLCLPILLITTNFNYKVFQYFMIESQIIILYLHIFPGY